MSKNINDAIKSAAETMKLGAQVQKDKGRTAYKAKMHAALAGYAMAKELAAGLEPTAENLAALFHALYNHSAWRQKFEDAGIFPKAKERAKGDLADLLSELEDEGA